MKKVLFLSILLLLPIMAQANVADRLAGRILLQVEAKGEAFYVHPQTKTRYFLGRPADAFSLMRQLGLGISNQNIAKLPVGLEGTGGLDTDGDGLPDSMEQALGLSTTNADTDQDSYNDKTETLNGFNPNGTGRLNYDNALATNLAGKILLQVESQGEAWYVNPVDLKRYYLGRPADAFAIMRALGLGISNQDLNTIAMAEGAAAPVVTSPDTPTMEVKPLPQTQAEFLNSSVLLVVAPNYYDYSQYLTIKNYLLKHNIPVVTVSSAQEAVSTNDDTRKMDRLLEETRDILDYKAIVFIGGAGAQVYEDDANAKELLNKFRNANKIIGAIGKATRVLAKADILNGVKATAPNADQNLITNSNGILINQLLVSDQNIITLKDGVATELFIETLFANL